VAGSLATSRIAGDTSKAAALVNFGLGLAWVTCGAPVAEPTGAETMRPVTTSSGTSQRARLVDIRTPTVDPLPWPDGQTATLP
jgi:hypothetical protein